MSEEEHWAATKQMLRGLSHPEEDEPRTSDELEDEGKGKGQLKDNIEGGALGDVLAGALTYLKEATTEKGLVPYLQYPQVRGGTWCSCPMKEAAAGHPLESSPFWAKPSREEEASRPFWHPRVGRRPAETPDGGNVNETHHIWKEDLGGDPLHQL